jgi:hypothetical protein
MVDEEKWDCPVCAFFGSKERGFHMNLILLIILIVLLLGAIPAWPYSRGWGYFPSGGLGLVIIILLILMLMGRI